MHYGEALTFVFKSPRWFMTLLCVAVCLLIPAVGPMVVIGYCIEVFAELRRTGYASYPDFEFRFFTRYLGRGVFPFLVGLVVNMVMVPVMMCCIFPSFFAGPLILGDKGEAVALSFCCAFSVYVPFVILLNVIAMPIVLRAIMLQDFAKAFNFAFARDFVSRVGMQTAGMAIVYALIGVVGAVVGICLCFVGIYLVSALLILAHYYSIARLYDSYVARGGEALVMKETGVI